MPILTEKELQDILSKETEANAKLEEKNEQLIQAYKDKRNLKSQKTGFVIATVLLGILFLSMIFTVLFKPKLLGLNEGITLAEDEVIVKKLTLEDYQNKIMELEAQTSDYINPLELDEFYAVQLGAFKKFNTKLSSDNYSIVNNANFKDFNLYTLGVFKTREEAEKLLNVVMQLNFKDAFVGLYRNGERIKAFY